MQRLLILIQYSHHPLFKVVGHRARLIRFGRLAQRESTSFTRKGSQVQTLQRAPNFHEEVSDSAMPASGDQNVDQNAVAVRLRSPNFTAMASTLLIIARPFRNRVGDGPEIRERVHEVLAQRGHDRGHDRQFYFAGRRA